MMRITVQIAGKQTECLRISPLTPD